MTLTVGLLRQAVSKVAAEMWCLRCSLDSPVACAVFLTLPALTAT